MLLPGPEAQQLAVYIGWLLHKTKGGLVAGTLFVLPGLLAIMALELDLRRLRQRRRRRGAVLRPQGGGAGDRAGGGDCGSAGARSRTTSCLVLAAAAFVAIFVFDVPFPLDHPRRPRWSASLGGRAGLPAFVTGGNGHHGNGSARRFPTPRAALGEERARARAPLGLLVAAGRGGLSSCSGSDRSPALLLALGPDHVFTNIAVFFSKMAVVTFGGAYAVLAYVAQQAVETYGWLQPGEMLDGLGLAETTPGPLIMVTQFVGFLGRLPRPGRAAAPSSPARSAACSPPG